MSKRGKVSRRPAEVPTGLLDAYTESSSTASTALSDSDKFKQGYVKKKDKGKQKRTSKKSETEEEQEGKEEEEVEVQDSWDAEEEVIESWDQLEVEEMPVPQKVKAGMRKEEKKRKKEEKKATSQQQQSDISNSEVSSNKDTEVKDQSPAKPSEVIEDVTKETEKVAKDTDEVTKKIEELSVAEPDKQKQQGGGKQPQREYSDQEKAAIKAEREAKKAAKANKKAGTANNPDTKSSDVDAEGKTKEQLKAERKAAFELQQKMKAEAGGDEAKSEKSKAELKAERRAKQEAQRAAKEAAANQKKEANQSKDAKESKIKIPDEIKADDKKTEKKLNKNLKVQNVQQRTKAQRQIGLFSHLHQYERELSVTRNMPVSGSNIHPSMIQLGLQHAEGEVVGSSGRCISLLLAIKSLLNDSLQQLASAEDINKEVDSLLKPNLTFLKQCRQLSISMSNAIRYVKREIRQLEKNLAADELKSNIDDIIDDFINVNFTLHPKAISETANKKIRSGDVILTYSYSKLVEKVLLDAVESGKKLKVIIADERVEHLGMNLAKNLVNAGVHTTYILLTAVSQILPSVTKVLLGCDGVMANGCVLATVGTSQVALLAKSCNKPVTFFSETYKFTERVQTDSFVYNELLDPDSLVDTGAPSQMSQLSDWRDLTSLSLLHLVYDLTPAMLVDSIVTEISEIPPTSVPVILRLHNYKDFHHAEHDQ